MAFADIFLRGLLIVMVMMTLLWVVSVFLKNASIVDLFWGTGFVVLAAYYFWQTAGWETRKLILLVLVVIWGLRLSIYLSRRNIGRGEDFRYRQFREKYGVHRYWWVSFFQVFLLQGVLMWLISAPLLGAQYAQYDAAHGKLNVLDGLGVLFWLIGMIFEAGGDFQMARFKANPQNKGKVLDRGFWKYTRHPNYFGDACVWWGYGLLCLAGGSYWPVSGSLLMTFLIIRVSGVFLLERSLKETKPLYADYIRRTSAFFPWFPRR
jgi:steroid 5-alpha reductase family enzyme